MTAVEIVAAATDRAQKKPALVTVRGLNRNCECLIQGRYRVRLRDPIRKITYVALSKK